MGLILGILVAVITVLLALTVMFANSMASAGYLQQNAISVWPVLLIGGTIAAVLIFTHYHHIGW